MKLGAFGLATSAVFLLMSAQAFAATVIFDDFNKNQLAVDAPYPGSTSSNSIVFGSGTRTLTALNTTSNGNPVGATTIGARGGILSFSNNDQATGSGTVSYTNVGDISNGPNPYFFFDVGVFDNVANFTAYAEDKLGHMSSYQEVLSPSFSPFLYFSQFLGTADFNNLSKLSFKIDTTNVPGFGPVYAVDGSLKSISLNAPSAVPLPAGGILLLVGLSGLFVLRSKKRA